MRPVSTGQAHKVIAVNLRTQRGRQECTRQVPFVADTIQSCGRHATTALRCEKSRRPIADASRTPTCANNAQMKHSELTHFLSRSRSAGDGILCRYRRK
jgi:hypothetical protein